MSESTRLAALSPKGPAATPACRRERRAESGSAYIIALMVLLVLTILGLALALITQSEVQVGANERLVNRVFYAADAAFGDATTRALFNGDHGSKLADVPDVASTSLASPSFSTANGTRVSTSPFLAILDAPCNLCEINQGNDFYKINHVVNSTATRIGGTGSDEVPQAEKSLGVMFEIQPLRQSTAAIAALSNPDELRKIKF